MTNVKGDLFVNIQKYCPRENINPKENFFTEILCFLLKNDKLLLKKFCLLCDCAKLIENFDVDSQVPIDGKLIDIEIAKKEKISIIIENKIDSSIDNYQLENYLEIQNKRKLKIPKFQGKLILISQLHQEPKKDIVINPIFKHIYWADVYLLIKDRIDCIENETMKFLLIEFKKLLEDENMTPLEKIDFDSMDKCRKFLLNMKKIFDTVTSELNIEDYKLTYSSDDKINYAGQIKIGFYIEGIKFILNFDIDEMKFYLLIYKRKDMTDKQRNDLIEEGINLLGKYFTIPFEIPDDFFDKGIMEQKNLLRDFYREQISNISNIIFN